MTYNKYRAVKTVVDGITFDSKREAARYQELQLLEKAGEICNLDLQVRYDFEVYGVKLGFYKADFVYFERLLVTRKRLGNSAQPQQIVEDCKGFKTPIYKLKKKLMKALHGIDIYET